MTTLYALIEKRLIDEYLCYLFSSKNKKICREALVNQHVAESECGVVPEKHLPGQGIYIFQLLYL